MLSVLLEAALRSALLCAGTWLAMRLLKIRDAQTQLTAWTAVLLASFAMPLLMQVSAIEPSGAQIVLPDLPHEVTVLAQAPAAPAFSQVAVYAAGAASLPWPLLIVCSYALVSGILLLRFALGLALTGKLAAGATSVHDEWTAGHDVRTHVLVRTPMTFGSTILLPAAYLQWPAAKRRAVMAHEGAHVRHGDFYVQALGAFYRMVFWFNPLAWWLKKQLAELAEAVSDDAAIANLGDRPAYAEILLDISQRAQELPLALAMAKSPFIHRRVERVIEEAGLACSRRKKLLVAVSLVPLMTLAAGATMKVAAAIPSAPVKAMLASIQPAPVVVTPPVQVAVVSPVRPVATPTVKAAAGDSRTYTNDSGETFILGETAPAAAAAQKTPDDVIVMHDAPAPAPHADATEPRLVVDSLAAPAATAQGPVIEALTSRTDVRDSNGTIVDVLQDFHFTAPKGNAIVLHRELVDTSGPISQTKIAEVTINIPMTAQQKGAVVSGGWHCGTQQYYVTMRAFIMDADGGRSNPVDFTVHCNGG